MNSAVDRLKIVFLIVFAIGCAGIWAYHVMWVWPARKCESVGGWWDGATRLCGHPMSISSITGRPEGMSRKEWSEKQAAKMIEREAEGYPSPGADTVAAPAAPAPAKK